jgi:hypothetical protein
VSHLPVTNVSSYALAVIGLRCTRCCATWRIPSGRPFPQEGSWYSFLFEGHNATPIIRYIDKSADFMWNETRHLPARITVGPASTEQQGTRNVRNGGTRVQYSRSLQNAKDLLFEVGAAAPCVANGNPGLRKQAVRLKGSEGRRRGGGDTTGLCLCVVRLIRAKVHYIHSFCLVISAKLSPFVCRPVSDDDASSS